MIGFSLKFTLASKSLNSCATEPAARMTRGSHDSTIFAKRSAGLEESIGTYEQSALRIAIWQRIAVGDFGIRKQTRSPFLQPAFLSNRASRFDDSSNCLYVTRS